MAIAKSAAVGSFVPGGLAPGVVAILLFGGSPLFGDRLRVVVFFKDSVAGLAGGAPVTLRGVKVGTVQSMKAYLKLPELVPVIPVYLQIEPDMVSGTNCLLLEGIAEVALNRTTGKADTVIGSLNNMTVDWTPARDGLEATVRDLAAGAASPRNVTHELERKPGTLLSGRSLK